VILDLVIFCRAFLVFSVNSTIFSADGRWKLGSSSSADGRWKLGSSSSIICDGNKSLDLLYIICGDN